MLVADITTYNDIRALLGVHDVELEDSTLALEIYSANLTAELEEVALLVGSTYTTTAAINLASRTDEQQRFYLAARLFSAYVVAKQCTSSLPMFGPKDISDSKTLVGRFSDSPYKETIKRVVSGYETNKARLVAAYAALSSTDGTVTTRRMFGVSSPTTDRVTG